MQPNDLSGHSEEELRTMVALLRAELQMREIRRLSGPGPYPEHNSPYAVFDELHRNMQALLGAAGAVSIAATDYSGDDYPRAGCKLVIELGKRDYSWRVYAPGVLVESGRALECYAARPLASVGIAIDAFAHGAAVRSVLSLMSRAEREAEVNSQNRDPSLSRKAH